MLLVLQVLLSGMMCRFGEVVTLKTRANVNMCMDWAPAPGGKYRRRK